MSLYATYWMCYVHNGGAPTHKHPTRESAETEAKRLCERLGRPVDILQAQHRIAPPRRFEEIALVGTAQSDEDLPF
jgi:hypothetical protein